MSEPAVEVPAVDVPAVWVVAVSKYYAARPVLSAVDLVVPTGRLHALLGPNGAGKTTLLRLVLGLVRPDRGRVDVLARAAAPGQPGVAGFVDAPAAWPYLTGRRNLQLLARLDGGDAADRVEPALERVGLRDRAGSRVNGWSTGERQRLGLAAALLRAPRLLVLDEPTSGLDPAGVGDIHDLLRELVAGGTTVLLSSHDLAEVATLAQDVTVLCAGTVRWTGRLDELRALCPPGPARLRTCDDARARTVPGVGSDARGLLLPGDPAARDAVVLALAAAGVAVRVLTEAGDPLTRAFLELTA